MAALVHDFKVNKNYIWQFWSTRNNMVSYWWPITVISNVLTPTVEVTNHIESYIQCYSNKSQDGPYHFLKMFLKKAKSMKKVNLGPRLTYVCYITWESHSTKIIVARLLKLIVFYIRIDESVWHPNTEPKFFRTRFVKRLRPAEKFVFQIM